MVESANGQDKANPEFWLGLQAGNKGLSCGWELPALVPQETVFLLEI